MSSKLQRWAIATIAAILGAQLPGLITAPAPARSDSGCSYRWGDLNRAAEQAGTNIRHELLYGSAASPPASQTATVSVVPAASTPVRTAIAPAPATPAPPAVASASPPSFAVVKGCYTSIIDGNRYCGEG